MDQKVKVGKRVNQMTTQKEDEDAAAVEWKKHFDQEYGEYWLCTAAKRPRVDDQSGAKDEEMTSDGCKGNDGGKAGNKGRGKGPKGGCHECQGDHYVRPGLPSAEGAQGQRQRKRLGYCISSVLEHVEPWLHQSAMESVEAWLWTEGRAERER